MIVSKKEILMENFLQQKFVWRMVHKLFLSEMRGIQKSAYFFNSSSNTKLSTGLEKLWNINGKICNNSAAVQKSE